MEIEEIQQRAKDFIQGLIKGSVQNSKGEDMVQNEKVDKRDIIRQIMAIAGKEEASEDVRTIAKLAEKLAYDDSEAGTADNEVEEEEIEEKVTENEDEEKEEKFEEEKEIADVKNKCKGKKAENKCKNDDEKVDNSIEETKKILFGGISKENTGYMTREERIELGNNY